jgi:hypothetical protein
MVVTYPGRLGLAPSAAAFLYRWLGLVIRGRRCGDAPALPRRRQGLRGARHLIAEKSNMCYSFYLAGTDPACEGKRKERGCRLSHRVRRPEAGRIFYLDLP